MSNHVNFINRFVRWILPLVALLLIALYLVLSPVVFTHAAPATHHNVTMPQKLVPEMGPDGFGYPR